ncbi:MAG: polysaccharide deacetylase family protein [Clostridiales bacterium]|nr:polysaccharide deacetylase family protein [Clostridiales bacterium]
MEKGKRKIITVVTVLAVLFTILYGWKCVEKLKINGGWYQNGKAGSGTAEKNLSDTEEKKNFEKKKQEDNAEKLEKRKKERVIVENTDYNGLDNTKYGWWFKRNDNHEKSGCQEDFDITEYNAYYAVPVSRKVMYITFDCGYENGYTADILDTLKEEEVTAAFFVTQTYIRDNIELTKRMKEEGHLVCNHSVHHPSMPDKTVEEQKQEILECENYMKEATGYEMDLFFRPPRGEYSKRTLQIAKDLGYRTIFWSMAYLDYDVNNQPDPGHVVEHFSKYYHPGAIPLLHNVSKANHDALPKVIRNLKKEGYTFGNLYDLVEINAKDAQK